MGAGAKREDWGAGNQEGKAGFRGGNRGGQCPRGGWEARWGLQGQLGGQRGKQDSWEASGRLTESTGGYQVIAGTGRVCGEGSGGLAGSGGEGGISG